MTILHIDDFEAYDVVRSSGSIDLEWISKQYVISQTQTTGLRLALSTTTDPYQRPVLKNVSTFTGRRSVYLPLGQLLMNHQRLTIGQKLVDYVPNGAAIGGLSVVGPSTEQHILVFGFTGPKNGFVRYVGADGTVEEDPFILPTSLGGRYDTVEWTFEKEVNDRNEYRAFNLWVNNRPVYTGQIMCQIGASSALHARILGGLNTQAAGTVSSTGFLSHSNTTVPAYGTTDLVVTDGQRMGRVRIISRQPDGDIGPNTMQPNIVVDTHADAVNVSPPSTSRYLTAVNASDQEVFWSQAYTDLSSENVLAVAVQVVSRKNSPDAWDVAPLFRLGGNVFGEETIPTDLVPNFGIVVLERNPWTNLNWTPLEANSLQYGAKVG